MLALWVFTDMGQVFQTDDALWVRVHNAPTDTVVAVLLQPSLSSANDDHASCGGTSAFFLQPFSQSRIVIGFGTDSLARIEMAVLFSIGTHREVTLSHVDADHVGVILGGGFCSRHFKRKKQVELLLGLVIPQPGCPDMCSLP